MIGDQVQQPALAALPAASLALGAERLLGKWRTQ